MRLRILLITTLLLSIALTAAPAIATAQTASSSTAVDRTLSRFLKLLKCDHTTASIMQSGGLHICPSLPLTLSSFGLDSQFHSLEVGAGFGFQVPLKLSSWEPSVGLAVVPLVQLDHVAQQGVFSLLLHLDVFDGFGGGLLYRMLVFGSAPGQDTGFQAFHAKNLFLVFTIDLPEAI